MRKGKRWLAAAVSAAMIVQSLASVDPVYAADDGVSIADTFTDSSFRSYVSSNFDKDSNGYLSDAEIANVTSIDVSKCSPAISSLNGVELFTNLSKLDCNEQSIRNLDIENLENLEYIDVSSNRIDSLTLPVSAEKLTYLDISGNKITSLTSLADYNNLVLLNANSTNLSSIDVSNMKGLKVLGVSGTTISTLDLGSNMELTTLYCDSMRSLPVLDVSGHEKLKNLYCAGAKSDSGVVVRSSITKLDVSGDIVLGSLDCSNSYVAELNIDNTPALTTLDCSNTRLTSIDVSKNTSLSYLDVSSNVLGAVDFTANTALRELYVKDTGINKLDVSTLTNLVNLDASSNSLAELDIASNSLLEKLYISDNNIQGIKLDGHPDLKELEIDNNNLVAIDISVCPKLYGDDGVFSCSGNSRDITLDTTNYDYDFSDFSKVYGLHKAWYDYELPVAVDNNGKPLTDDNGVEIHKRNRNTTGYAGIQGIDASNEASSVTGGQLDGYIFTAEPDAEKITYNYYTGAGMGKVKFTLNILNPLKVTVWYTTDGNVVKSDSSTLSFRVGDTTTLTATDDEKNPHKNITWSSSNERVAQIDRETGELTCVSAGTAQINILLNDRAIGYVNMECHKPVTGLYLVDQNEKDDAGNQITYENGAVINMDCGTYPRNGSKKLDVKCVTEDGLASKEISGFTCKVTDADGKENNKVLSFNTSSKTITTRGAGIAFLHFTSTDNPDVETVIQVNVEQRVNSVTLSQSRMTIIAGGSSNLVATVSPNTAVEQSVVWSSSNESIATVDAEGNVKAVNPGEADIICTSVDTEQVYGKCHVTVQPPVKGLTLNMNSAELLLGADTESRTVSLEAVIDADDASIYKNLKWTSSDTNVASVSYSSTDKTKATVTARSAGTAVIRFSISDDEYVDCNITVKQRVTSLRINRDKTTIYAGDTLQVTSTASPATASNQEVIWASSDESVASIDKDGLITALDRGTTVITATAVDGSEKTTSFTLTVKKYVSAITLDKDKLTLYVGERGTVKQTVLPEDANDRNVIWQSSDPGVATVSNGTITGVKAGTTNITCTARDGSGVSKTCEVTVVQQISSIVLGESTKTVNVGDKFTPNVTLNPENASKTELKWTSSSEAVASVDQNGEVTAKSRGTATITCEAVEGIEGRKAKAALRLTVNQPVTGIKLNQTKLNLFVGKQGRITSTVAPANANNRNVEWTTSNSKVATVNNGTITAVSKGTAVITCKAKDGSGKLAKCTVTVSQPVTSIKLNATNKTIKKGATFTLKATVGPAAANNKAVTWSSSNTKVATVSSTGVVKAVGKGSAVITCKSKDGSNITAKCTINSVIMVSSIKLNKKTATIKRKGKITLRATVGPATANNKAVTWVSSNKKIATVTTRGTVVGKKKGRAVIKCKAKDGSGKYAKCTIIVK